jgi:hypothetical protein
VSHEDVDAEVVRVLARVAGIELPDEDLEPLVGALRAHLARMKALELLDLGDAEPVLTFDPRWE